MNDNVFSVVVVVVGLLACIVATLAPQESPFQLAGGVCGGVCIIVGALGLVVSRIVDGEEPFDVPDDEWYEYKR